MGPWLGQLGSIEQQLLSFWAPWAPNVRSDPYFEAVCWCLFVACDCCKTKRPRQFCSRSFCCLPHAGIRQNHAKPVKMDHVKPELFSTMVYSLREYLPNGDDHLFDCRLPRKQPQGIWLHGPSTSAVMRDSCIMLAEHRPHLPWDCSYYSWLYLALWIQTLSE